VAPLLASHIQPTELKSREKFRDLNVAVLGAPATHRTVHLAAPAPGSTLDAQHLRTTSIVLEEGNC
jgi:hypothetical protein